MAFQQGTVAFQTWSCTKQNNSDSARLQRFSSASNCPAYPHTPGQASSPMFRLLTLPFLLWFICSSALALDANGEDPQIDEAPAEAVEPRESLVIERIERERSVDDNRSVLLAHKRNYFLPVTWAADPNNEPYENPGNNVDESLDNLEAQFQISLKLPIAEGVFYRVRCDLRRLYPACILAGLQQRNFGTFSRNQLRTRNFLDYPGTLERVRWGRNPGITWPVTPVKWPQSTAVTQLESRLRRIDLGAIAIRVLPQSLVATA